MSVSEISSTPQSWEWFVEKSANVVRFLAPVIEANRRRRDLPRDLQEALDFFLSIALSDGLKLMSFASGRALTGRELTECVRIIRERGESGFEQVLDRLADRTQHSALGTQDSQFELIVGMRALIDDQSALDLPLIDDWLCNFDWRNPIVQDLRELTCRARVGEISLEHYILSVRLVVDALEAEDLGSASGDVPENLFIGVP